MYSVENTSKWYCFIEFLQIKVYSKLIYGAWIYGETVEEQEWDMGAENKRRKKWLRRTAAVLAAVLVLAELPVQVTFASQTEPVTEESISSVNIEKAEPEGESQTESGSESETESEAGGEPETVLESGTEPEGSQAEETSEEESTIEEITEEETTEETTEEETTEEETTTEEVTTEEETVSEEEEQLDYIYGRELTEEEIAAQKALEPKYLPEMEVFELPEVNKKRKIFLDGTSGVTLEASYDAREEGILNPVRNQNPWGTCWSFASLGIMESALIKEGEAVQNGIDLSERHLAYFVGHTGYDVLGNASGDTITSSPEDYYLDKGGNFYYAAMKLMNWQGGAAEADYPYINAYSVPDLATETAQNDIAHIENCFWLGTAANDADTIQAVKTMIKQYGAVAWSYYHDDTYQNYSTSAYYNYINTRTNHAIMVVGWDDNYKKENFGNASNPETQPTKDGAWIVRNSWGSTWGDGGYFYISYEDLSLGSGNGAAVMTANLADDYDNNYFYGNTTSYNYSGYYYQVAQVYQIKGLNTEKEKVSAVSFMTAGAETEYSIQLYKNPELEDGVVANPGSGTAMLDTPVTGTTSYAGLYTVKLPTPVTFSTDDYVAVVITFPNGGGLMYTDQSEGVGTNWEQVNETAPGQSFYSYSTGNWFDMHSLSTPRSFRINMLTEDVGEAATVPVINSIVATEPEGFDSSLFYNIRWVRCSNAVGYEIYRAETENGTYTKIGETGSDVRTYKDAIGKADWQKDYYYKVRALFENDVFTESEPVLAESEGILRTVLNSVENTGNQITIKWKAVSGAEGYRIERKEQNEAAFIQIADVTGADSTSYVDDISALAMGYYEYRVQAYTATETAEWSEKMTVAKGLSISITPLTYNTAKYEWPAIEGADRYKIYIQNKDATHSYTTIFSIYVSNATQGAPCKSVLSLSQASNFKTGDTQTSYIEAVDTAGNVLSASGKITFHTKPNPLTVSASNVNRKITFSWTGGEGSSAVYIYRSMDEENPGDEPYAVITDTGVCEFEDSEFAEYGVYYYWLYPGVTNFTNEIIYGDGYSYQATIAMDPVVVTSITALNEGALKIVWGSEEEADSYSVYRCTEETGTYQLLAEHVAVSEYVDDTVITGKTYYYKITRHKGGKSSALSETIPKKGQTVPDKPVLAEATYKSITVENNSDYEYAIQTSSSVTAGTAFRSESDASLMFDNLTPATNYYVFVRTKQSVTGETPVYGETLQVSTEEYPLDTQWTFSPVNGTNQIEAYVSNADSSVELQIQNQQGTVIDKQYFTFISEDSSVCTVAENGVVKPNPSFKGTSDKKVKITATAVGDPANRKVDFYVTVLASVPEITNISATQPTSFTDSLSYNLQWSKCSNPTGYEIYRSETENGTYVKVGDTGADASTYNDVIETQNWGKDYYYKVKAIYANDAFTESVPELAECEVTLQTKITSVNNEEDLVTVKWQAMDGAGGYRIERKAKKAGSFEQIANITEADKTTYQDDISELDLDYYEYRVQAYTGGTSARWSEKISVAKRLDLTVTPMTYNKVKFQWQAIDGANIYQIYWKTDKGDIPIGTPIAGGQAGYEEVLSLGEIVAFETGETMSSYVAAVDENAEEISRSKAMSYHTTPNPLLVEAVQEKSKITFTWSGGEGADGIYIYRSMDANDKGATPYKVISCDAEQKFEDSEFSQFGTYYYWIYPGVTNSLGELILGEGYSGQNTVSIETITISEVSVLNEGTLKISWEKGVGAETYSIYRSTSENEGYELLQGTLTAAEYEDSYEVITGKTYYYKVIRNKNGQSSSLEETLSAKGQTVPNKPSPAEIDFRSIAIANNPDYEYAIQTSDVMAAGTEFRSENERKLVFDNLTPATDYYIFVRTKESVTGEESVYGESLQARTAEYPFGSQIKFYAVDYASQIEAFTIDENSSMELNIRNQYGEVLDKQYFSFTSADPSVCTVDENGVVIPNPSFTGTRDKKVKITAEAIGDPLKRKVTFYVTILTKKQVASVEIDKITDGIAEKVEETVGQKFVKGTTLTFRAKAFDSSNAQMDNPALNWSISDSSIASWEVNNDKTVTVTLKKAGRVNLTCKAKDSWQKETSIQIAAYSTEPVISTTQVTVNKKASERASNRISDAFTVQAKNGATASTPVITEVKTGRTILTPETGLNKFSVVTNPDGSYSIAMESSFLETVKNNTVYSVTLHTDIGGIPEISENGTITESFTMKVKILSKEPAVTVKVTDINRIYVQEEDLKGCLILKAPDTVTSIRVLSAAEGQVNNFDNYFEAVKDATGQWYLQFDDSTGKYNKRNISGKLEITVNGYEPVIKSVTVKTPSSLPVVKQQQVPTIQTSTSGQATIKLYNSTKKELLEHFMIQKVVSVALECPEENTVLSDGSVTLAVKDGAEVKEGATLSATLTVMAVNAEGENCWQKPLNVKVQVKVYKDKAPSISMKPDSFTLNKQTPGEKAKTVLSLSCENVPVSEDSTWQLYAYNSKTRKYDLQGAGYTDWLTVTYEESSKEVSVGFVEEKSSRIKDATYKFKISHVAEGYEEVYKEITVKVINKQPAITVKTTGKLDLVKRADCTLSGKLTLQNIPSGVSEVIVQNEDRTGENPYYRAELAADGKTFKISMTEAGLETPMTTAKVVLPLEIQLENGQKVQTTMSFKPVQSTPVIKVPTAKTLYKSLPGLSVDYDLTSGQTAGTKIKKIDTVDVSEGILVTETEENGHLKVELSNRGIKSGTYKIKVNIYFEGAQVFTGYPDGKPLTRTITVKVAE